MKKILFYALAACAALSVGCSKDAGIDQQVAGEGKYTLPAITASLDDAETRTSEPNATTGAVNWSNTDRIAVIDTKNPTTIYYYRLSSGAGTPVGKFEPVGNAITFNDINDIKAVYPAVAAEIKNGKICVTLNNDKADDAGGYSTERLVNSGITSWTPNSTAYAFSTNDIKVSYSCTATTKPSSTESGKSEVVSANFKFRQLATWCSFTFDFSDTSYKRETMENFKVTTTSGNKAISGTAEIDFTADPQKPTLKMDTENVVVENAIERKLTNSFGNQFTVKLMLFPVIKGTTEGATSDDQLKFVVTTSEHEFTFYATPSTALTAGTVMRFPFNVDKNFEPTTETANIPDFKYAVNNISKFPDFYYYGDANCHLITGTGQTQRTIYVTPHKASPYYEKNDAEDASDAPKPTYAKVIWYETALGAPSINGQGTSAAITGNSFTVTLADAGQYGNALVGIYESETSDTPLWSYHIWHPKDDPTNNVLTYKFTKSGTYEVMPMALGATTIVTASNSDEDKLAGVGLWYQWGRKDPLGRASYWGNGGENTPASVAVTAIANTIPDFATGVTETVGQGYFFTTYGVGADNLLNLSTVLSSNSDDPDKKYMTDANATVLNKTEIEQTIDEEVYMVSADRYMIDKAVANPTKFIYVKDGVCGNDWAGKKNDYLWGNSQGYNWPEWEPLERSIFDPCPAGWRVAPKDLWIAFTDNGENRSCNNPVDETYWANALFNIKELSADGKTTTMAAQRGYSFYYDVDGAGYRKWHEGNTDFYLASGYRDRTSGALCVVGSHGYSWSSSPASGSTNAGYLGFIATGVYPLSNYCRANGFPVRCVREK